MGNFTITESLEIAFKERNITYYKIRPATADGFFNAITKAKQVNDHGAFVTRHSIEEYEKMRLFVTEDGTAGIAITSDNNIVSIFNGGEKRGVLKTLLPVAIKHGGAKLDNFNSPKLSAMYELYGFSPVSKVEFDSRFAPDDWNYKRDGEPDIVFWIHNGDSAEDVVLNFGRYIVPWDAVEKFDTYEEAAEYRDEIMEYIKKNKINLKYNITKDFHKYLICGSLFVII